MTIKQTNTFSIDERTKGSVQQEHVMLKHITAAVREIQGLLHMIDSGSFLSGRQSSVTMSELQSVARHSRYLLYDMLLYLEMT